MRCPIETPESADLLLAYSAQKLDAQESAALQQHMEACPSCRAYANSQQNVWKALDAWEAPPVSADFDRRLYARIEKEVSWWDLLVRPFRPLFLRQGVPIAAAAGVVLMAGFLLQRPVGVPISAAPQSAQVEVAPEQAEHTLQEMEMMREFNRLVHTDPNDSKM